MLEEENNQIKNIEKNPLIPTDENSNTNQIEKLEISAPSINSNKEEGNSEQQKGNKKSCCKFPSAYLIILILEVFIFILTYLIPKGKFWKLEYLSGSNQFRMQYSNGSSIFADATKDTLKNYSINIPLENFINGKIKKPLSIPKSYEKIDAKNQNFLKLFVFPIYGLIDSCGVSFFLLVLGGCINLLIEMKALTEGLAALSRITKGKEFLLLTLVFIIISIGGSTFGMCEETFAFFPILMPIFLKSGIDGMLGMASIYLGSMIGIMFQLLMLFL